MNGTVAFILNYYYNAHELYAARFNSTFIGEIIHSSFNLRAAIKVF